ncbi:MAG TPA: glycosyltransferase family 39 protein, partial [Candidatus Acidoferrales bacterium]|nr:glycosyltransferase family 39 protein [Candidatus Acidoferrales bacterium]
MTGLGVVLPSEKLKDWGRLGLLIASLGLAWLAHRDAWSDFLPWWRWVTEALFACALFELSQPAGRAADESTRRRYLRWFAGVVMLLAIAAAIALEPQVGHERAALAATFVAIAAFAAWRWVPFSANELAVIGEPSPPPESSSTRAKFLLEGVALIAAASAMIGNFYHYHLAAFLLWLVSLAVFALAMRQRSEGAQTADLVVEPSDSRLTFPVALFAVLAIVAIAMAFRSIQIADVPVSVSIDEGSHGRTTEILWSKGFPDVFGYTPWNAFPNLSFLVGYIGVQVAGQNYVNLRLTSAAIGALSVVPLFFWARGWWGAPVGLMAAAIMALNREHLYWSRLGINNIQSVLVAALMLATLARALRTRRPIDWVWFGYASGLAFHTYHAAKLYPLLAALIFLPFAIGIHGFVRRNRTNAVIAVVAFFFLVGPLTLSTYLEWNRFYASTANRTDVQVLITAFQRDDVTGVRNYIFDHVVSCLRCLFNLPTKQSIFVGPESGALFLLGITWMLWRWRDPRNWVVLAWIGGILVIGGMMTGDPPWKARMLGFLPALCVVPAIVVDKLRIAILRCVPGRGGVAIVATLLLAWLSMVAYRTWDAELVYAAEGSSGDYTGTVCRLINRTPLPATFYAAGCGVSGTLPDHAETMGMFARSPDRKFVDLVDDGLIVPVRPGHRGLAVLVVAANQKEIMPLITHYYPN